jgi:hypothetical protein
MDQPHASSRPSRLSSLAHVIVVAALGLSFISGVLVWYGQGIAETASTAPAWLHRLRVLHGFLNPLLCGIFGYLVCQHIRYGWALRANWLSGLVMEGVFLVLIVSSLVVYYADEGAFRTASVWTHRLAGAGLPVVLGAHWLAGRTWVKKNLNTTCN